ncbi:CBS domain-containing protein [Flavobacteriaceae bacterium]|jgi:CBS domain-containing protein|nr:CBS domain-containing protein [Flavobacteriaceae bacterium]
MKVQDVMITMGNFPVVDVKTILKEALTEMGEANLGLVCITDESKALVGLITDGDLRRKLLKVQKPFSAFFVDDALSHAKKNPIICNPNDNLKEVVQLMGDKQIWDLPVVDENNQLVGLLHLHPAIKKLIG